MRVTLVLLLAALVFGQSTLYYTPGPCPAEGSEPNCQYNEHNLNFECSVGDFHLQVTGNQNVPKYTVWSSSDNSTTYKFQLQTSYEATYHGEELKKEGGTNIGMASLTWSFSDVAVYMENITFCGVYDDYSGECVSNATYCYAEASFNITNNGEGADGRWTSFVMVNHLGMGNESSLPESTEYNGDYVYHYYYDNQDNSTTNAVKIDFVITDYNWVNNSDDVYFAIECKFQESGSGDSVNSSYAYDGYDYDDSDDPTLSDSDDEQSASYDNGFFSVSNTANATLDGNSTVINVNLTQSGNTLTIVYSHFDNGASLVHDPSLGVSSKQATTTTDNNNGDDGTDLTALWVTLGVIGSLVLIGGVAAAVVGAIVYQKKKNSYAAI